AHEHFLRDMLRMAADIPSAFIVCRFKYADWTLLPRFATIVAEIESRENLTISTEYDKPFFSYGLCAHSDLVIAKPTSLADECLAVGIPVLFHDYTHNT